MILIKSNDENQCRIIRSFLEKKKMDVLIEKDIASAILAILQKDIQFLIIDCTQNIMQTSIFLKIINKIKPCLGILILSDSGEDDQLRKISTSGIVCRLMKPVQNEELELAYETIQNFMRKRC